MGELKVKLTEQTENAFREAAMHQFGHHKGSLSLAAEQALENWSKKHKELDKFKRHANRNIKDPVEAITGLIKGVKIDSVRLQHEVHHERAERWKRHVSH